MGRPARIDRKRVRVAAARILDTEGLAGLSLERLAGNLGVSAPALYYHYEDKAAILDDLASSMLADLGVAPHAEDWRETLIRYCHAFFDRVTEHPNLAVLLIEHLPQRAVLRAFEANAAALERAGVPRWARAVVLESVQHYLWGLTLHVAVASVNPAFTDSVDRTRYPRWADALDARPFTPSEILDLGVRALLDGIVTWVATAADESELERPA